MRFFLSEIRDFFRTKSVYRVLFLVIVFFYALFLLMQKAAPIKHDLEETSTEEQTLNKETVLNTDFVLKKISEHPENAVLLEVSVVAFLALFSFGVFLEFSAVRHFRMTGDFIHDSGYLSLVPWGIADVFKVTILFFSAALILNVLLSVVHLVVKEMSRESLLLIHAAIVDLAAVGFIMLTVKKNGSKIRDLIGWHWSKIPWREIRLGIQTYVMIFPTFLMLVLLLVVIANVFSYEPPPHPLVQIFMKEHAFSPWVIAFSLFLACVIGPVVEEIFFRGFFYPALKRYFSAGWAMAATAALFALVHENLFSFVPIFFLGFVLCYLYEKRSSIVAPIFLHITHNLVFLGYFFLAKKFLVANFFGF